MNKILLVILFLNSLFVLNAQDSNLSKKIVEIDSLMYGHQGELAIPIIDSILNTPIKITDKLHLQAFKIEALVQIEKYEDALSLSNLLLKNRKLNGVDLIRTHIERALLFEINNVFEDSKTELNIVGDYYKNTVIKKDELYGEYLYRSSSLYKILGEIEKSIELANEAKAFGAKYDYKNVEATASMLLLDLLTNNGTLNTELEFELRKRLLLLWKQSKNNTHLGFAYIGFSYYYIDNEQYKTAHKYLDSAFSIGKRTKDWVILGYTYHSRTNLYEKQGHINKAFKSYKKYKNASDSLKLEESIKKIFEIQSKFNYEKAKQQTKEIEIKRINTIYLLILISIILVLVITSLTITKRKNKKIQFAEDEVKQKLKEKEFLLKELNHRVKNNLALILSLVRFQCDEINDPIYKEKFRSLENRIRTISTAHNELLYNANNLASENYDLKEYLLKISNALVDISIREVKLNISTHKIKLNIDTVLPIGILINELISNSIKHAKTIDYLKIDIDISLRNDLIYILYEDSGTEFRFTKNKFSLGINIIESMVQQLKGIIKRDNSLYSITLQIKNSKKVI